MALAMDAIQRRKRVLVVDDDLVVGNVLEEAFTRASDDPTHPYGFDVTRAEDVSEAVTSIRQSIGDKLPYDVVVLDLSFTPEGTDFFGGYMADALGLYARLGQLIPVIIVFSGYVNVQNSVALMRCGAWDVIDKASGDDDVDAFDLVVRSAIRRLTALDAQATATTAAVRWLHRSISMLQDRYANLVIAIGEVPNDGGKTDIDVIASAGDAFELEERLRPWRRNNPEAMQPYVVKIPVRHRVPEAD
jgi:CheY-like chemotaxis protein